MTAPATEAQTRYLVGLTDPDRLARLSAAESGYLIGFLRGPPPNMTRGQQLYLAGLVAKLPRGEVPALIDRLRNALDAPAPLAPASEAQP